VVGANRQEGVVVVMERVLVGTDGSSVAQGAVEWAARLTAAVDGKLVVVSAWRRPYAEVDPATYEELLAEARRRVDDEWCAPARDADVNHEARLVEGDPRTVVLEAAADTDADLVVVGARGSGYQTHPLHLGSVTHHLIHHTDRPLAAIPPSVRSGPPARIVVGVDGSDGSARAVAWCVELGRVLDAEVTAVYSERVLAEWVRHSDPRSWYRKARHDVDEWAAPLRDAGLRGRAIVEEQDPVTGLTDAALGEGADLLVVGSHGRGGVTGLRLGSTALKVLHHGALPVVLVPSSVR
jgi:nucleotide-binding universal stress UspA family protein